MSHLAELKGHITLNGPPLLLAINETFLDKSVEKILLGGFQEISRRDRRDGSGGGVMLFAADKIAAYVTLIEHSATHERSWHAIHSDTGPVLLCVWYRPPNPGEIASIRSFEEEWAKLRDGFVGTAIVGDLNLHHKHWLRFSSHVSVEGTSMFRFCRDNGFKQWVRKPTRDNHLLDLFITDMDEACNATVLPRIADHHVVRASLHLQVPQDAPRRREVWLYKFADWASLASAIVAMDWSFIDVISVDEAAEHFTDIILHFLREHTPTTEIEEREGSHPWLNARCFSLIKAKRDAEGTPFFGEVAAACSAGILEEYNTFIAKTRVKLRRVRRGSKQWWRLANRIANRGGGSKGIPALKHDSSWVLTPEEKANLLADTFRAKHGLPMHEENVHSHIGIARAKRGWISVRWRCVRRVLRALDIDSGTGPDGIPTRVLATCADAFALPIAKLCRRILVLHRWPSIWIVHHVVALRKRNSVYDPDNYRGVHLTSQVSKVVERVLSEFFCPTLERLAFGANQFAYRKKHGARDAIAFYIYSWVLALCRGCKVGIYCSDVSGAFDRVSADRLIRKLAALGIHADLAGVIRSWLRDRSARVVVAGSQSAPFALSNMVFQGTVWGPPLWNTYHTLKCQVSPRSHAFRPRAQQSLRDCCLLHLICVLSVRLHRW